MSDAIGEYEDILTTGVEQPGFLSPMALRLVRRKLADARQILSLMPKRAAADAADAPGSGRRTLDTSPTSVLARASTVG